MLALDCGTVAYTQAMGWMRDLVQARLHEMIGDVVLILEHDRVYTAGRRANIAAHVLGTRDIPVVQVDRGGDMTYHGPGQLVAYPVVRLRASREVRGYVAALQEACVRTAADFGVRARADDRRTGVWVGDAKLAAIGIRVDRGVTSHGLAFNVAPDLDDFAGIVPCGLPDAGVCSLASLGVDATVADVGDRLVGHLAATLDRPVAHASPGAVGLQDLPLSLPAS